MVMSKKKICRFCETRNSYIDYKEPKILRKFITDQGKIIPRRVSGMCAKHQREMTTAIKRARNISLIPYSFKSV